MEIKTTRLILISILVIILTVGMSYGTEIQQSDHTDVHADVKVVMIIINRVDFNDLENMPYVRKLIDKSSIALMNTRASGKNSEFKSYATVGWGTRADASQATSLFYGVDENIKSIYERRTGKELYGNGIVNLDINKLIQIGRASCRERV